jgi:hypothetical protein
MDKFKQKRNIRPFDGEKYNIWKFRIRSLLSELDVIHIVDEEIPENRSDECDYNNRVAKNILAVRSRS